MSAVPPLSRPHAWALVGILSVAAILRAWGGAFALPQVPNIDEPLYVDRAVGILETGDWNPHWFANPGSIQIYFLTIIYAAVFAAGRIAGHFASMADLVALHRADPTLFYLAGRTALMAVACLTLLVAHRVGRRLVGELPATLGVAFLAVSPLLVEHAKYVRTDTFLLLFALLTIERAVAIAAGGRAADYRWAGLFAGLAVATKYSAAPLFVVLLAAHAVRKGVSGLREPVSRGTARVTVGTVAVALAAGVAIVAICGPWGADAFASMARRAAGGYDLTAERMQRIAKFRTILLLGGTALLAVGAIGAASRTGRTIFARVAFDRDLLSLVLVAPVAFFAVTPFILVEPARALHHLAWELRDNCPGAEPLSLVSNAGWYLNALFLDSIGPICGLIGAAGIVLLVARGAAPGVIPVLVYMTIHVAMLSVSIRFENWVIPLVPFVAFFAGWAIVQATLLAPSRAVVCASALAAVALVPAVREAAAFDARISRPWTANLAEEWVRENVPHGTAIAVEGYTCNLWGADYRVTGHYCLGTRDLESWKAEGVRYVVVGANIYERVARDGPWSLFYKDLFARGSLVYEVREGDGGRMGHTIRIYDIGRLKPV